MIEKLVASTQSEKLLPQSKVVEINGDTITVKTKEYLASLISDSSNAIDNFFAENTTTLSQLLGGYSSGSGKETWSLTLTANYENSEAGVVRLEEIVSFATVRDWKIQYLSRRRPALENSNTPGEMDPGLLSHGGIPQAGIVNAWRYVADKLGKNDNQLTEEEYTSYLESNPFPQWITLSLGKFILTNGHKARNQTPPTSGLMNARIVLISPSDFDALLTKNNTESRSIEYTVVSLGDDTNNFTPKHTAFDALVKQNTDEIIKLWDVVLNTVDGWKNAVEEIIKS